LVFSDLVTGLRVNLSRDLVGNFDITGGLTVNSRGLLQTDTTLDFDPNSGMLVGGTNSTVTGQYNFVVNGDNNTVNGQNNTVLFSTNSTFEDDSSKNVLIGCDTVTFASGVVGSALMGDDTAIRTVNQSRKLIIDFASGQRFINDTVFEDNIDVSGIAIFNGSAIFQDNVNITGNLTISGNKVTRFLDITGASGANTIIENDNIASGDGVLRIKVGSKIFTVSGSYA
jgi:hypothetical protein